MKKIYFLPLLLLPVFFVLHNYNDIFGFITARQILTFFLYTGILTGIFYALLYYRVKNKQVVVCITFSALVWMLFFGPMHDFLKSILPGSVLSSYKIVVPLTVIILLLFTRLIIKRPAILTRYLHFLWLLTLTLCLYETAVAAVNVYKLAKDKNLLYPQTPVCDNYVSCNLPDSAKPDIYYIILDEYTNNKTLEKLWNYNNSDITNWLSERGFYIVADSRSNYNSSVFSISSIFNMNYVDRENGSKGTPVNNLKGTRSLSHNETFCLLKKEGYTIRFLAPFKNSIEANGLIDYFDYMHNNRLYGSTFPGRFQKDILWNFITGPLSFLNPGSESKNNPFAERREDVQETIDKLKETIGQSNGSRPKFVYGHFLITHEPHLFDSTGGRLPGRKNDEPADPFETYIQQVKYTNTILKDLVADILANNKHNTVIIIQGDHGFRNLPAEYSQYNFPAFNTLYFPGSNYNQLYDNVSLVNTFRIFFNRFYCQNLPLLKDSSTLVIDYE